MSTCESLADFPALGRHRSELDDFGLEVRSLVEGRYGIYYTTHQGGVFIVRVLHGARDIDQALVSRLGDAFGALSSWRSESGHSKSPFSFLHGCDRRLFQNRRHAIPP